MVIAGLAIGFGIIVLLNPVRGVHEYIVAFEFAFSCVDVPLQIAPSANDVRKRFTVNPTVVIKDVRQPRLSFTVIV